MKSTTSVHVDRPTSPGRVNDTTTTHDGLGGGATVPARGRLPPSLLSSAQSEKFSKSYSKSWCRRHRYSASSSHESSLVYVEIHTRARRLRLVQSPLWSLFASLQGDVDKSIISIEIGVREAPLWGHRVSVLPSEIARQALIYLSGNPLEP